MTGRTRGSTRLTVYPIAVLLALALGVILGASNAETSGETYGADYPAFYGAGSVVGDGDWDELYEFDRQLTAQRDLGSVDDESTVRYFAYPPQVALAYQPLAAISYYWSYVIHTLLMAAMLWSAVLIARPMVPWLRGHVALAVATSLLFWPMFRTVTGGSNTALTLLLVVAAWRLVHEDREFLGGLVLAGLLYKPQFAVPLVGLFLLGRYWRVVMGAVVGGLAFYLSGAALLGWSWVTQWFEVAQSFGRLDAEVNGHSAVSFIGFAENLFGVGLSAGVVLGWGLAAATVLGLSWLWWRSELGLDRLLAVTMPGLLLLSLHAMSHDGAVVVLTAAVVVARAARRNWVPWVATVWALGASQLLILRLGWSPGLAMLLFIMWWEWRHLQGEGDQAATVAMGSAPSPIP